MSVDSYGEARPRYYGVYRGRVTSISDPMNKHRIKVSVPQVYGKAQSSWADACLPVTNNATHTTHSATITSSSAGDPAHTHSVSINLPHSAHTSIPTIGQTVWVMFEGGDPDFPVWIGVSA